MWMMGELAGEGLWLWLLAVVTSMVLQGHYNGTLTELQGHKKIVLMLLSILVKRVCVSRMRHCSPTCLYLHQPIKNNSYGPDKNICDYKDCTVFHIYCEGAATRNHVV